MYKRQLLYREIFEKYYPGQSEMIVDFWMPNKSWEGCDVNDPSARVLSNYGEDVYKRQALSRLSSNVRPTLMTSPVAFIWVESVLCAAGNLSNGKRGILVTT